MFMLSLATPLVAAAPPANVKDDQTRGREILAAAEAQRERIMSGDLVVTRRSVSDGGSSEARYRAAFQGDKYRVDILQSTYYETMMRHMEAHTGKRPARGESFESLIWDGQRILARQMYGPGYQFKFLDHEDIGDLRLFNAAILGLPQVLPPFDLDYCFRPEGKVIRVDEGADRCFLVTVEDRYQQPPHEPYTVTYTIDPTRDYSVVGYRVEATPIGGIPVLLVGTSELEQFDGVWFPKRYRHEECSPDGSVRWAYEYEVHSANFNQSLSEDHFGWPGLEIPECTTIFSSSEGMVPQRWVNGRAITWVAEGE